MLVAVPQDVCKVSSAAMKSQPMLAFSVFNFCHWLHHLQVKKSSPASLSITKTLSVPPHNKTCSQIKLHGISKKQWALTMWCAGPLHLNILFINHCPSYGLNITWLTGWQTMLAKWKTRKSHMISRLCTTPYPPSSYLDSVKPLDPDWIQEARMELMLATLPHCNLSQGQIILSLPYWRWWILYYY